MHLPLPHGTVRLKFPSNMEKKKYEKKGTRTPLLGRMNPTDHLRLSPFAQPLLVAVAAA